MLNLFKKKDIDYISLLTNDTSTKEENSDYRFSVVHHYEELGYNVWNHTSDRGHEAKNINIIAKKSREIILIHCHIQTTNITKDEVKEFEKQRDKFIEENPIFAEYEIQLRYSLTGFFLTEDAFWYIQEHTKFISYEIRKSS